MPVSPKNLFISESRVFLTDYGVILSWLLSDAYPILRIPDKLGTSAPAFLPMPTTLNNLKGSPIIIAGGYGVGSKENFNLLFDLAKELHAEVGASRAAVDAGFADHDRQIGQTGVTVRPKLYIACGISGQIQHIAGMQESGIIISINNDPDAPINTIADYVINGSIEEVVPKMIKYYKQNSK